MAKMQLTGKIRVKFKPNEFTRMILDITDRRINTRLNSIIPELLSFVQNLAYKIILASSDSDKINTYGLPAWQLGIPFGKQGELVRAVAQAVSDSVTIKKTKVKRIEGSRNISGKIGIFIIPSDYLNIISLPEGNIPTEKGDNLPILKWILTLGDNVTPEENRGFKVVLKRGTGRSGGATTVEAGTDHYFKIPSSYSGTEDDNWLTRAFKEQSDYFKSEIKKFVQTRIFK
jgi:hypothetical protein